MAKLKIYFKAPKDKAGIEVGKAENIKKFAFKGKLIESDVIDSSTFYYIFEYETEQERNKIYVDKVPAANLAMKKIWHRILRLFDRGNKLMAKFEWNMLKMRKWVFEQFSKEVKKQGKEQSKTWEDYIDEVQITDLEYMRKFIEQDLIWGEIVE